MNESKIISTILSSRESYLKLLPIIEEDSFSEFGKQILKEVNTYYDTDATIQYVDKDLVKDKLIQLKPKKEALIQDYFVSLPEPSSADNIVRLYQEQVRGKLREDLIIALSANDEKKIVELFNNYITTDLEESTEEIFHAVSIDDLAVNFNKKNLIPIYPTGLNEALGGGVPRQSQICIFARPDVGKTAVAINAAVGAAEAGFKVLYIGNEDPSSKMVLRILTRFTRVSERELLANTRQYYDVALERGYGNLYFVALHPGNPSEIRGLIEKIKPDLVVIDQLRNCNFKPESMTINLEQGVITMRNLAKEFNFVSIVVTQAGNSAVGKIVLGMEDVEWSNTGVAAQMDLMIGVGQNEMMKEGRLINLSFPKNKLTAPIRPFTVNIDYERNRLTMPQ